MARKRGNGDQKRPQAQGRGLGGSVLPVRGRRPPYPYIYGKTSHRHSEHAGGLAPLLTVMVYLSEASRVLSTPYPRHSKL
jgi:hypothetical protein